MVRVRNEPVIPWTDNSLSASCKYIYSYFYFLRVLKPRLGVYSFTCQRKQLSLVDFTLADSCWPQSYVWKNGRFAGFRKNNIYTIFFLLISTPIFHWLLKIKKLQIHLLVYSLTADAFGFAKLTNDCYLSLCFVYYYHTCVLCIIIILLNM